MKILFSPIGTADPMTQLGDGPMLHIVRHEMPDKVVLFLTSKMAGYEHADHRYTKAIKMLCDQQGVLLPDIEMVQSDWQEVQRFDHYIKEFEEILKDLATDENEVLVNVSSGTPGMSQALVALGSFGYLDIKMLQVPTPKKDTNGRDDREDPSKYDFETLWELDCELEDGADSRITVVESPNFKERLLRQNARVLVNDCEYAAALDLVQYADSVNDSVKNLIAGAKARLCLDQNVAAKAFGGTSLCYRSSAVLLEYLYVMEVRLKQGHNAEFMRSMTPALAELMQWALRPNLPDKKYRKIDGRGKPTDFYNAKEIDKDLELSGVLNKAHIHYNNNNAFVSNEAYLALIKHYCKDDSLIKKLSKLRDAERKCRNYLAHTLTQSSKESIEKKAGMSLDDIMKTLYEVYEIAKMSELQNVSAEPGLYDRINELIVAQL